MQALSKSKHLLTIMKQITDIKELRQIQIGILDEIVRICDKNGIKYSLSSGTLLGAVRHKGYIPWDDDIDLYMMRSEYKRFVECFNSQAQISFKLLSPDISENYIYLFGKVIDQRTIMQEDEIPGFQIGVYVDIFPIDYVPEGRIVRDWYYLRLHLIKKLWKCKAIDHCYLKSKTAYYFYRYSPISLKVVERILNRKFFNGKTTNYVCNLTEWKRLSPHRYFSTSLFDNLTKIEFEGKSYSAFCDYNSYLSNTYGNYMNLPPLEERTIHHFKAWWKD